MNLDERAAASGTAAMRGAVLRSFSSPVCTSIRPHHSACGDSVTREHRSHNFSDFSERVDWGSPSSAPDSLSGSDSASSSSGFGSMHDWKVSSHICAGMLAKFSLASSANHRKSQEMFFEIGKKYHHRSRRKENMPDLEAESLEKTFICDKNILASSVNVVSSEKMKKSE